MAYALRKIYNDLTHHGFKWDISIGAVNTAPDWKPTEDCGNGLHFCALGDNLGYLDGDILVVVEYDETKAIDLGEKHKAESCKIVWVSENGSTDGLDQFVTLEKFFKTNTPSSEYAYYWALNIGDREHMRQFVTESGWAYFWARNIGDREHMRQFVTGSEWAYAWARNIGDRKYMRQFVTEQYWAYRWARDIGDREHMRQFVTDSEWAYAWARDIGDKEHMRQFVTDSEWAYYWARNYGDKEHMKQFITDSKHAYLWAMNIGDH